LKGSRDHPELSGLRGSIGSQVFSIAFFAAEEDLFPPEGDSVRLFLGNITLADGVLDHLFARLLRFRDLSFRWEEGMFEHPVYHHQNK
jgi:hypothetical protein